MGMRGKRGIAAVACALIVGLSAVAQAKVIYVDDDANMPGDGSSWATAFTWLQHALAAAEAGDEIHVAQGFYRPNLGADPESRPTRPPSDGLAVHIDWMSPYAVFQLKNGVALRGGFAGMAADDPNVRDERRYQTILSGDLNGNDQEILQWWGNPLWEFLRADNSLHVVESAGTDSTAVLEGFVIESAVESGLLNLAGSPSIVNCIFRNNSALYADGGGLRCEGGRLTLSNCVFERNLSGSGGAVYAAGTDLTLAHCHFSGNWAPTAGTLAWPGPTYGTTVWQLGLDHCIAWDGAKSIGPSRRTQPHVGPWEEPEVVIRYSNVQGGWHGKGNIDADPCFAAPGYWVNAADLNTIVDPSHPNGLHVDGDYHLKSQAGRWDPVVEGWVLDEVTSPCIDAGDPNRPVGDEPEPNGGRINMGAYGGTAEASKSYVQEP